MKNIESFSKLKIVAAMLIFGSVGIFRALTPLPSVLVAIFRGLIGALFLLIIRAKKINFANIKKNLPLLICSGATLGINWFLLFEAFNHTSISAATLYYYMAPLIIIIASPFLLKERFKKTDILLVLLSLLGIALVSGFFEEQGQNLNLKGLFFGIGAAIFYAATVLINKKITGISATDKTITQLLVSSAVLLPFFLLQNGFSLPHFKPLDIWVLVIMGVVHTGLAYALYFGGIETVKAKTAAILSYIDPVFAIILSSALSLTPPSIYVIIGAVLILGSSLISEIAKK